MCSGNHQQNKGITESAFHLWIISSDFLISSGANVIMRQNKIRDMNADFLQQACYDVKLEPDLLPIESNKIGITGNTADKARLDS
jgi:hypothetical protein